MHTIPAWVITDVHDEDDLGVVKRGKEAQINLIERHGHDGRSCVFARKGYLPREVKQQGELEALGVQTIVGIRPRRPISRGPAVPEAA